MKIVWKIIKYIVFIAAATAFVTGIISMTAAKAPAQMKKVLWNDALTETYVRENGDIRIWYVREYEDNYSSPDGTFYFSRVRYIPDAEQWQVTVGCNDSTVRDLAAKRGISLDTKKENFSFVLKDDNGNMYGEYDSIFARRTRHAFRRLIFDGVSKNGVSKLTLCIYYTGDTENGTLPEKPLCELKIYDSALRLGEWTGDDGKAPPESKTQFTHCKTTTNQSEETTDDN